MSRRDAGHGPVPADDVRAEDVLPAQGHPQDPGGVVQGEGGQLPVGQPHLLPRGSSGPPVGQAQHVLVLPEALVDPGPFGVGVGQRLGAHVPGGLGDQDAGAAGRVVQSGGAHHEGGQRQPRPRRQPRHGLRRQVGPQQPHRGGAVGGHHDDVGAQGRAVPGPALAADGHPGPVSGVPVQGQHLAGIHQAHPAPGQIGHQGLGKLVHPALDPGDLAAGRGGGAQGGGGGGEAAVLADPGAQTGGHGVRVQLIRIGGVDAGGHRGDEVLGHGPAHPGAHQSAEGALLGADAGGQEAIQTRPVLPGPAEGGGQGGVQRVAGDPEDPGGGHRHGACGQVQPGSGGAGAHDALGQAQLAQQGGHGVVAGGEGLRAGVQHQSGQLVGGHHAAEVLAPLQHGGAQPARGQLPGRHQPGDAAADDEGGAGTAGAGLSGGHPRLPRAGPARGRGPAGRG
ncbi:Uncharacterised protein [Mycobacteroides abscessus subsp. abscessus]|nr:Uncharacterised protein [Mycobacteroides abscessus subsp. abscessus]